MRVIHCNVLPSPISSANIAPYMFGVLKPIKHSYMKTTPSRWWGRRFLLSIGSTTTSTMTVPRCDSFHYKNRMTLSLQWTITLIETKTWMSVGGRGMTRAEGWLGLYLGLISFTPWLILGAICPALSRGGTNSLFDRRELVCDLVSHEFWLESFPLTPAVSTISSWIFKENQCKLNRNNFVISYGTYQNFSSTNF